MCFWLQRIWSWNEAQTYLRCTDIILLGSDRKLSPPIRPNVRWLLNLIQANVQLPHNVWKSFTCWSLKCSFPTSKAARIRLLPQIPPWAWAWCFVAASWSFSSKAWVPIHIILKGSLQLWHGKQIQSCPHMSLIGFLDISPSLYYFLVQRASTVHFITKNILYSC